ncbi:glycosyl hydrolase family 18 [Microbacterium sp. CH12i]|uniref:carbohydrate-binding protein n=1 Tax=Microbacterium sp. CH12i TaxID=1479651 RepID=UPI000461DCF5|nr:carbohydrate-binding protein [Microbacterium sp. CH12i]KDA04876.1 glycosyl hydrolase family 18 [Microbacterium sp. CH12i]
MTTNPTPPGLHRGRRLSGWRVLIGVVIALAVIAGAVAVPWYLAERAPAATTPAGPRWFGGYFDVTAASVSTTPTVGDGTDDTVVLAFVVAAAADQCEPSWGAAYSLADAGTELDLDRRVDNMRRDGAHVAVSFGGALNTELGVACSTTSELADAYRAVIDRYRVSTIDLDLENESLADAAAGARRAAAVAQVQKRSDNDLSVWLTLPTATDGLTDQGIAAVRQLLEAGVDLTGVNAMTMDYGTDLAGKSMAEASISALEAVNDQLTTLYADLRIALPTGGAWALLGATPMIGQNDVVDEVFTIADAQQLNEFATKQRLARMSMWSINRDRTCGPNYPDVSVVSDACSGVEQNSVTFASVLSPGFDESPSDSVTPSPVSTPIPDDPKTSPYPIWSPRVAYSAGVRVVWHGYVYVAKWWVTGAPEPDDPTQAANQTSWTLLGAVLPDDEPFTLPTVAAGTYPEWIPAQMYETGARVVVDGVPFEAKWWTQGEDPTIGITDHDRSPWTVVMADAAK